jgi:hypothetical protein
MLVIIVIQIRLFKNKKKLIYIAIWVLYIISTPIFSNNLFTLLEGSQYRKPISAIESADAIVVLSVILGINEVRFSTYIYNGETQIGLSVRLLYLIRQGSKASFYRRQNAMV